MMWNDKYITRLFGDDDVKVNRFISSPATPDEVHLEFSDGSRLFVTLEVAIPPDVESEAEAAGLAAKTTAHKAYTRLMRAIIERASAGYQDTDLGLGIFEPREVQ